MTTLVEWIHPSVRDLVIDHLATHDADRADFLRKASPTGLVLALSTGGGSRGERALPLLRTEDDWTALGERASEVATVGEADDHHKLLEAFAPAIRYSRGRGHQTALTSVVAQTLSALRDRWDASGEPIMTSSLQPYCFVSEATDPLVPLPNLAPTWQYATRVAGADTEPPEDATPEDLLNVSGWLRLARLVAQYEPRLLRQVRAHQRYQQFVAALLRAVELWLQDVVPPEQEYDLETDEPYGLTSEDEETEGTLIALEDPLRNVGYLLPQLEEKAERLAARAAELREPFSEVEREREEWLEQRAQEALEDWDPDEPAEENDSDEEARDEPTIEELFADL